MKKTIITIAFALVASAATFAQTSNQPAPKPEVSVAVMMTPSQISLTQQVLRFAYDSLLTSDAPSKDVQQVRKAIESIFPLLHEPAMVSDSTKKSKPIKK